MHEHTAMYKVKEGHLITNGKQQHFICINIYMIYMLDGHIFLCKKIWKMFFRFNLIFWVQLLRYASNFWIRVFSVILFLEEEDNNLAWITTMECVGHGEASIPTPKEVWNHIRMTRSSLPINETKQQLFKTKRWLNWIFTQATILLKMQKISWTFWPMSQVCLIYIYYLTNKQLKRLYNNAVVNDAKLLVQKQPHYNMSM